jgi:hypothetical protein
MSDTFFTTPPQWEWLVILYFFRRSIVEMHLGAQPYYKTPCLSTGDRCREPLPTSGMLTFDHA